MSLSRFVFKSHKWLAVAAGLLTLIWFVSGIVMVLPVSIFGAPGPLNTAGPPGPGYKEVAVSIPQAIATVEKDLGQEIQVTGVEFRRIAGRLLYRLLTEGGGSHLMDAVSGQRYVIDEAEARRLLRLADPTIPDGPLMLVRAFDSDYRYGPLPAYRMDLQDARGTAYYIGTETGEARATNRGGRWRGFLAGMHTFDFLQGIASPRAIRLSLALTSVVGTAMTLFGFWILWIQFVNWRARRRTR